MKPSLFTLSEKTLFALLLFIQSEAVWQESAQTRVWREGGHHRHPAATAAATEAPATPATSATTAAGPEWQKQRNVKQNGGGSLPARPHADRGRVLTLGVPANWPGDDQGHWEALHAAEHEEQAWLAVSKPIVRSSPGCCLQSVYHNLT